MMARLTMRTLLAMMLTALLAVTIGCGEDTATDDNRMEDGQEPPAHSELLFELQGCQDREPVCPIGISLGSTQELSVKVVEDGNPVSDIRVDFDLNPVQGAQDTELTAGSAFTDDNGVAETEFRATDESNLQGMVGEVDIDVTVPLAPEIEPLTFNIAINTKDAASYHIEFVNEGNSTPNRVEPLLFDPDNTSDCQALRESFFDNHQWPSAEIGLPHATVNTDGSINPVTVSNIDNNDSYLVLGVAQQQVGGEYVDVGFGCKQGPEIEEGLPQHFEVPLNDHIPHIGDRYDTYNEFDIAGALPDTVQSIIGVLDTLANNPEEFIISGNDDTTGLVDDIILDALPDDSDIKDYIETILENDFAVSAIQDFLDGVLEDLLPDWFTDAQDVVGDITGALQEFTVTGEMRFDAQPVPSLNADGQAIGEISEDDTRHIWDELIFEWSVGCDDAANYDDCAQVPISSTDVGVGDNNIVDGHFNATVIGTNAIEIEHHAMSLHYGMLIIGVLETMVLPRIFGDDVDSFDALFDELIGCHSLASAVGDEDSSLYDTALSMCEDLRDEATDALYDYVADTLQVGGDGFVIGTPTDAACSMQQPEQYVGGDWPGQPLPYAETFGLQDEDGLGCDWALEISYSDDPGPDHVVDGVFDAELAD